MRLHSILRQIRPLIPRRHELSLRVLYSKITGRAEPEMHVARRLCRQRRTFIDVGAHYGSWTYYMSRHFDSVEAFEPLPVCVDVIRAAELSNVNTYQCALSSSDGEARLQLPIVDGREQRGLASLEKRSGPTSVASVICKKLDNYNFGNVDLMKIDVEGHEDDVIAGAMNTLMRCRPLLVVELEVRHRTKHPNHLVSRLSDLGYQMHYVSQSNDLKPIKEFDSSELRSESRIAGYINNFIFVPQI
jgi:FkbM family methyltransferase